MEAKERTPDPLQEALEGKGDETLLGGLEQYSAGKHMPVIVSPEILDTWEISESEGGD